MRSVLLGGDDGERLGLEVRRGGGGALGVGPGEGAAGTSGEYTVARFSATATTRAIGGSVGVT